MRIRTTRFGLVDVVADDIFVFPNGLVGYPSARHFVLLTDSRDSQVVWLQSLSDPQLAFAAVNPSAFVDGYRVCATGSQLAPLGQRSDAPLHVLALVSAQNGSLCLNLKAPILLDPRRAVGCQVVTSDDQPMRAAIADLPAAPLRRAA